MANDLSELSVDRTNIGMNCSKSRKSEHLTVYGVFLVVVFLFGLESR